MEKIEQIEKKDKARGNTLTRATQAPQACYWFFTLNNYKIEQIDQLEQIFKHECKWYIFQEEIGESGTPHLQGTICLIKKQRLTELKKIDNSIHWESTKCVKASIEYCTKYETRHGKVYSHGIELPEKLDFEEPRGWQLDVMEIIKNKPDSRSIYWFWEPKGNCGKTTLCKYLVDFKDALMLSGKSNDMFHMLSKFPKKRKLILVDVPRVAQEYINYGALEQIKNGLVFSGKYEGCQLRFNPPHLIIFANEPPKYDAMSQDRWRVTKIQNQSQEEGGVTEFLSKLC